MRTADVMSLWEPVPWGRNVSPSESFRRLRLRSLRLVKPVVERKDNLAGSSQKVITGIKCFSFGDHPGAIASKNVNDVERDRSLLLKDVARDR